MFVIFSLEMLCLIIQILTVDNFKKINIGEQSNENEHTKAVSRYIHVWWCLCTYVCVSVCEYFYVMLSLCQNVSDTHTHTHRLLIIAGFNTLDPLDMKNVLKGDHGFFFTLG